MPSYLVETFLARCHAADRAALRGSRALGRRRADAEGTRVGFGGVIHVPEDETCFFVFRAPSSREAALVAELAALDPVRVVEAVTSGEENTTCTA